MKAKQVGLLTAVLFYYFRSLLKTRMMAKQVGLLREVLFCYFRSLHKTRRMAKQVGLLTAGCQPWNFDVVAASGDRFVYCATLCVYIYQVFL
jgi:hypothetical protein